MSTTTTRPNQKAIDDYVNSCEPFLTDLEPEQQAQLIEDIREIVAEVADELDGDPEDLVGPPIRFVSELRNAAGLPPLSTQSRVEDEPGQRDMQLSELFMQLVRKVVASARESAVPFTRELLNDLRPAWWVARGIGLTFLLGRLTQDFYRPQGLFPDVFGSSIVGLLVAIALVVLSVRAGRSAAQRSPLRRLAWLGLGVVSAMTLVSVSGDLRGNGINEYDNYGSAQAAVVPVGFETSAAVSGFIIQDQAGLVWHVSGPDDASQLLLDLHESGYDIASLTINDEFGHQLLADAKLGEALRFLELQR